MAAVAREEGITAGYWWRGGGPRSRLPRLGSGVRGRCSHVGPLHEHRQARGLDFIIEAARYRSYGSPRARDRIVAYGCTRAVDDRPMVAIVAARRSELITHAAVRGVKWCVLS
jgi:hypothetical protein